MINMIISVGKEYLNPLNWEPKKVSIWLLVLEWNTWNHSIMRQKMINMIISVGKEYLKQFNCAPKNDQYDYWCWKGILETI